MTPIIRKLKILDGFDGLNQRRVEHGFARISATISTEKNLWVAIILGWSLASGAPLWMTRVSMT